MHAKICTNIYLTENHEKLANKYGSKFEYCKNIILDAYPDLKDAERYIFYFVLISKFSSNNLFGYLPIADNRKGICNKKTKTIYISDWALMQSDLHILTEILLHELIHINYPKYSEDEVVMETHKRMRKFQNSRFRVFCA